ncbi:hypothetical protein FB451DRAFT_1564021 [Mycena latifolia]|nr:hypothetical protein FB451DRAFT_1564021 [Mycena latifolia]
MVPHDVVDAIIDELDDIEALKTCSLAGTLFRDTSQRILLRSMTLTNSANPSKNYRAACTLLKVSPHIAIYARRLQIQIPSVHDSADTSSLQDVLSKLANVQQCIVDSSDGLLTWNKLTPAVRSSFFSFLSRQRLRELRVQFIKALPVAAF